MSFLPMIKAVAFLLLNLVQIIQLLHSTRFSMHRAFR